MEDFKSTLILAGMLAGAVNFFSNYIDLPFSKPKELEAEEPPKLKDIWWVAILGYIIVGIAGSFLTPLINALIGGGLKGLEWITENGNSHPKDPNYYYILFGYGLVFGYSTTRLLISLVDTITKKVSILELRINKIESNALQNKQLINSNAQDIINECENNFEQYKSDCSGLVKAVASAFTISLTGQADEIADQITQIGWTTFSDGIEAKNKADNGWFVVAGLKSIENVPPQNNGHVAIIVSGQLAQQKYPTGYWGKLGGVGEKNKTINWAWNKESRDKVHYSGKQI